MLYYAASLTSMCYYVLYGHDFCFKAGGVGFYSKPIDTVINLCDAFLLVSPKIIFACVGLFVGTCLHFLR